MLRATQEQEWWADQVQVMLKGKRALDTAMLDIGRLVAETRLERKITRLRRCGLRKGLCRQRRVGL